MLQYSIVTIAGQESLTVFVNGELKAVTSTHPNYNQIKNGAIAGDSSIAELFDVAQAVNSAFGEVTDRVTVTADGVWLDGEQQGGAITKVLMSLVEQGEREGYMALARFLERLANNPSHRSREQLYNFVQANDITIDSEGHLVLYKSVASDGQGGFKSHASGVAYVNGEKHEGQIPTNVGDVVTMPRSEISDDPTVACHAGLHAGARAYAQGFYSGSTILQVLVGPEHVVSVPVDSSEQKIRTEQYTIGAVSSGLMPAYVSTGAVSYVEDDEDEYEDEEDFEDDEYEVESESGQSWGFYSWNF